ncbi:MAG TPA: helix-turn-helix transcriptional regulator [Bdellovibrio sp.]|uniref:helix-turn-helix domain-containing protein n=1 Tax=Bdellovibrio sp. TaxID=28201 RepID=UPI002EE0AD71
MRLEETKIKNSLKTLMKQKGLQYKDLSKSLRISTATVKRRLNKGEIGISQLTEIAECLGVTLYELIEMSKNDSSKVYLFSEDQEQLFVKDFSYLMLFREIIKSSSFEEIKESLSLKEPELRKRLKRLEDVELIKLMPKDRISLLAKFPYKWRENGALQRAYFAKNIQSLFEYTRANYKSSTYSQDTGSICKPFEFLLSPESHKSFSRDLMDVYSKYLNLSEIELKSKNKNSLTVSGILLSDVFSIWQNQGRGMLSPVDI